MASSKISNRNQPRQQAVIYWKREVISADPSDEGRLNDAGPAWLQTLDPHPPRQTEIEA